MNSLAHLLLFYICIKFRKRSRLNNIYKYGLYRLLQILGVDKSASQDDVKKAYKKLARKYHPDNYANNPLADLAQEKMKEINEAYEEIQNQRKRGASGDGYGAYGGSYGGSYGAVWRLLRR